MGACDYFWAVSVHGLLTPVGSQESVSPIPSGCPLASGCPWTAGHPSLPGCPWPLHAHKPVSVCWLRCACGSMGVQSLFWILGIHQLLGTQEAPLGEHPSFLTPDTSWIRVKFWLHVETWIPISSCAPNTSWCPACQLAPSWLSQNSWPHSTRQPGHLSPTCARLASSSDAGECQHQVPFSVASLSPKILITIAFGVAGSGLCQQQRRLVGDPGIPVS